MKQIFISHIHIKPYNKFQLFLLIISNLLLNFSFGLNLLYFIEHYMNELKLVI